MLRAIKLLFQGSAAQRAASKDLWVAAARHYSKVLKLVDSGSRVSTLGVPLPAARSDLGSALVNCGEVREGVVQLKLAINGETPPGAPFAVLRAHLMLCEGLTLLGEYNSAESAYDQASIFAKSQAMTPAEILPGYIWTPEVYLPRLRYSQGESDAAAAICSGLLEGTNAGRIIDAESSAMASLIAGMVSADSGKLDKAEEQFLAATTTLGRARPGMAQDIGDCLEWAPAS